MSEVKNPRLIVPGDKIIPKGLRSPEVVRSVAIVVRMANGMDYVYEADEEVRTVSDDTEVPSEAEVLEALTREVELSRSAELRAEQARAEGERRAQEAISEERPPSEG